MAGAEPTTSRGDLSSMRRKRSGVTMYRPRRWQLLSKPAARKVAKTTTATTADERRKNHRDNQDFYSGKLSDTARTMSFGLAALAFALLSTDTRFATKIATHSPVLVIIVAGLACLAIFADSAQMLFGWFGSGRAANNSEGQYRADKIAEGFFFVRQSLFYLKLVFAFGSAAVLLIVLAVEIFSPAP